jgi:hypothetical protein
MQAIVTKYHGPTNNRDSRVSASCPAGRVTIHWEDGLGVVENHVAAVRALLKKLNWEDRKWARGEIGNGSSGFVFVPIFTHNTI